MIIKFGRQFSFGVSVAVNIVILLFHRLDRTMHEPYIMHGMIEESTTSSVTRRPAECKTTSVVYNDRDDFIGILYS